MKKIFLITFLALFIFAPHYALAKIMYVQSYKAKIHASPSFTAKEVSSLTKGKPVEVIKEETRWIQVRAGDQLGWMPAMILSPNRPMDKPSLLRKLQTNDHVKARKRASIQATAGATRGLRNSDRSRVNDKGQANYDALNIVEQLKIDEQDARQFHKELADTE